MAVFGSFASGFGSWKMRKWGQSEKIDMRFGCFTKLLLWAISLTALWIAREPLLATWKWFGDQMAVTASMNHTHRKQYDMISKPGMGFKLKSRKGVEYA